MRPELSEKAGKARKLLDACQPYHSQIERRVESAYKAYAGEQERRKGAKDWESQFRPPYANHIIETTMAGLLDERFRYRVTPVDRFWDPGEYEGALDGAKAHEILHRSQLIRESFDDKQRPFVLQALIAPLSVMKTYWRREVRPRRSLEMVPTVIGPQLREVEREVAVYDQPCSEVVDVRDFYWNEGAVSLEKATVVAHRVFMSFPELKQYEKQGYYENVDELKERRSGDSGYEDRDTNRETRDRGKDLIEVVEIWWREDDGRIWTTTLAGAARDVELRKPKPNPFWHGEYPFVTLQLQADLFKLTSIAQVEKIDHLQQGAWDLMNQRHDNVRLLNNAITLIRDDVLDPDAYQFGPRERWLVSDPGQVQMLQMNPLPAQVSIPAESMLKTDMQNLAGGHPFTSTSEARATGANTATEAALVGSLAQAATRMMKIAVYGAYARVGQQRTELNKQFMREEMLAAEAGLDDEVELVAILPTMLQGEYAFSVEPMTESLMRQERRAEANAKMTLFTQLAPLVAQMGVLLNARAFIEDWLESYDVENVERFFSEKPQQVQQPGMPPGQPGMQPGADPNAQPPEMAPNLGVTAPQAADAASPSNVMSQSPAMMMQRNMALAGGAQGG